MTVVEVGQRWDMVLRTRDSGGRVGAPLGAWRDFQNQKNVHLLFQEKTKRKAKPKKKTK